MFRRRLTLNTQVGQVDQVGGTHEHTPGSTGRQTDRPTEGRRQMLELYALVSLIDPSDQMKLIFATGTVQVQVLSQVLSVRLRERSPGGPVVRSWSLPDSFSMTLADSE